MKKVFIGMALGSAMSLAGSAYAEGPYGVVSLGQTKFKSDFTVDDDSDWDKAKDSATYASLGFGFSVNQNFAIQVAYNSFGEVEDYIWSNTIDLETEVTSLSVAALGELPLSNDFSIIGVVGFERWDADFEVSNRSRVLAKLEDNGTDFFYGIGVSYSINDQISLIAQYDIHEVEASDSFEGNNFDIDVDLDVLSVGAKFNF